MSRFYVFFVLAFSICCLVAAEIPEHELIKNELGWKPLCSTCKSLFTTLKEELHDGIGMTKEKLTQKLKEVCKRVGGTMMGKVCREITKQAIDTLYDYIENVDKKIDPQDCCETIYLC
ncbi:unnamed protein product [Bursaphelenchus xylophilus]|uniref:(pine wood nematode) hypothetical protein n=1 Tax=Bursaphelenchus xylophilus TaxID=6326 RepID=A0A1I7RNN4_BURXY|nr:unnamed protein product [Bursaphelenchus xylophilus]CAG9124180.1 unnamed protein product [Bursaphelenchus xylophilus]